MQPNADERAERLWSLKRIVRDMRIAHIYETEGRDSRLQLLVRYGISEEEIQTICKERLFADKEVRDLL